jgi:serine/threonine-protein kinase
MQAEGRYSIVREIASGSTATVYLAEDTVLRRKVALKQLHPHLWNHSETVRRFEKEAVAVASLSHENIIKVYDFGNQGRGFYLAMEYVDGSSLEALLKDTRGFLPNLTALSLFHQLLGGLASAHAAGIYHRDIKPSNVLVDSKGCVRVADFGIAFLSEETSITKTGSYLGTPGYSAPEQAQGLPATDKTDIFATGILFYRCLTGKLPFEAETPHAVLLAILEKMPPKANLANRRVLPGLAELVEEMLAKDPAQRPSALQCLEKLAALADRLGFAPDKARVRGFLADPQGRVHAECAEISASFAAQARRARAERKHRDCMKHFSLAEIFAEADSDVAREAAGYLAARSASMRLRARAGVAVALTAIAAMGAWIMRLSPAADKPVARPAATATAPAGSAPGIARPSVPAPAPAVPEGNVAVPPEPIPATSEAAPRAAVLPASPGKPAPKAIAKALPPRPAQRAERAPIRASAPPGTAAEPVTETLPREASAAEAEPAREAAGPGFVLIMTNPPFAKVRIDGKPAGTTPIRVPVAIPAGAHTLDLERDGCDPLRAGFNIMPGETASLRYTLDRAASASP